MFIFKKITLVTICSLFLLGNSFAGPANKNEVDHLVSSYLVLVDLSNDGNLNAISNKITVYEFLNEDQRILVDRILAYREESNNKS